MGKKKKIIVDEYEQRLIVTILMDKRNELIREEKDIDFINEVILKVINSKNTII